MVWMLLANCNRLQILNGLRFAIYINLYAPTSGSKEKKTYIHIDTVKKQQKQKKHRSIVHATVLLHAIIQY